ncbi:MAG: hypothetical protein JWM95_5526 [Gemmatimonadetes bacterium]|nr:hypothetical protein [Gemmatimonadota bacterium]
MTDVQSFYEKFGDLDELGWTELVRSVVRREAAAYDILQPGPGDDLVSVLSAVLVRLAENSRRTAARGFERWLVEGAQSGAPTSKIADQVVDALSLLAVTGVDESLELIRQLAEDSRQSDLVRLRAADLLVESDLNLPLSLLEDVTSGRAPLLAGPVSESIRKQSPHDCLRFVSSLRLSPEHASVIETPLSRAMAAVGFDDSVLFLNDAKFRNGDAVQGLMREQLAILFGDSSSSISAANPNVLSPEEHARFELEINDRMRAATGLELLLVVPFAHACDAPKAMLHEAVLRNLSHEVAYLFYVSKTNAPAAAEMRTAFLRSLGPDAHDRFEGLVTVFPYHQDWMGNTIIFYFFHDPTRKYQIKKVLAFAGTQRGIAIAPSWEKLTDTAAKALLSRLEDPNDQAQSSGRVEGLDWRILVQGFVRKLQSSVADPAPVGSASHVDRQSLRLA